MAQRVLYFYLNSIPMANFVGFTFGLYSGCPPFESALAAAAYPVTIPLVAFSIWRMSPHKRHS